MLRKEDIVLKIDTKLVNNEKSRMVLKLYTYFGLDSTRGQYYNVYIPTGDAQKENIMSDARPERGK